MPDKGRMATATTDENGNYEIEYLQGVKGCKIGPNTVAFFAPTSGPLSHPIPAKYSDPQKSEFKVEVEKGKNTFDFDLESDSAAKAKAAAPPSIVD
jgi:hypothetical protein